jgi:hypothetical protein
MIPADRHRLFAALAGRLSGSVEPGGPRPRCIQAGGPSLALSNRVAPGRDFGRPWPFSLRERIRAQAVGTLGRVLPWVAAFSGGEPITEVRPADARQQATERSLASNLFSLGASVTFFVLRGRTRGTRTGLTGLNRSLVADFVLRERTAGPDAPSRAASAQSGALSEAGARTPGVGARRYAMPVSGSSSPDFASPQMV